jgi:integrase
LPETGSHRCHPSRDAERPRTTRTKPFAPTEHEVRRLLAVVGERDVEVGDAAILLASTGVRKGELRAIRWADVDFGASELHVAAAISDGGPGIGIVHKPTKRSDWRDVPLTVGATQALRRQAPVVASSLELNLKAGSTSFPQGLMGWCRCGPMPSATVGPRRGEHRL